MKKGKIYIYGPIGGSNGVSAEWITRWVESLNSEGVDSFIVYINSPGGSYFEAIAIYNVLKGYDVEVKITGSCISAASLIAMAGNRIGIAKNSFFMVHNVMLESDDGLHDKDYYNQRAGDLEKIGKTMLQNFMDKTGKSKKEIKDILNKGDFLSADEAMTIGFVDEVIENEKINREVMNYVMIQPEKINKEFIMENKALRKKLGLPENATDKEVADKIDELSAKKTEKDDTASSMENRIKTIEDTLAESKEESFKDRVAALVDNAIDNFKINPADKDTFVNAAMQDFEATKTRLDAITKNTVKPGHLDISADGDGKEISSTQKAADHFKAMGRIPLANKKI